MMDEEFVRRLRELEQERSPTRQYIAELSRQKKVWELVLTKIDEQIALLSGAAPAEPAPRPAPKRKRRSNSEAFLAAKAVYERVAAERGRRWSPSELEPFANGFKLRVLVQRWNRECEVRPR